METENKNVQNFLKHDLKKIAILGIIILAILIVCSVLENQTNLLTKISGFLL